MRLATTLFVTTLLIGGTAWAGNSAPQRQAANQPARPASAMRTVDISEVVNPSDTLDAAKVEDASGAPLGKVQRVVTGDTGTVARIEVALNAPQKVVALTPEQVRYVPFSGRLRTSMTADQVGTLPAAKGQ